MTSGYELMEIARIGVLFLRGDELEDVMPLERRSYDNGDEIDYHEVPFNSLKRVLLLIERIDPTQELVTALWTVRPDNLSAGEVLVAGGGLPSEGPEIVELNPDIRRAFAGVPTYSARKPGGTVYYPLHNSDYEIVGVLEVSARKQAFFI